MKKLFFAINLILGVALTAYTSYVLAQNRVDLEDLKIKGELLNDNRLRLFKREKQLFPDRVNYRDNFRKEALDGLEVQWPELSPESRMPASIPQPQPQTKNPFGGSR